MRKVQDLLNLKDRVAIVTGGAGPIGMAFAETLAELGAKIALVDLDPDRVSAQAKVINEKTGATCIGVANDLSIHASAHQVIAAVEKELGSIDILINNAALTGTSGVKGYAVPFAEQSYEAFQAALEVNLAAAFRLSQAAHPSLSRNGKGVILNVGSIYGVVAPNMGLYEGTAMGNPAAFAASKGGLSQLTRYLSTVLAPSVRVNSLSPGGIARGQHEAFVKRYEKLTPLGRMGTEEDLKGALAFLVSDASAYVTGQELMVDGGWTAW